MKAEEREIRRKRRVLEHAVDSGNVAKTCRYFGKDAPEGRREQPPDQGRVIELKHVGGLHHEYIRQAA